MKTSEENLEKHPYSDLRDQEKYLPQMTFSCFLQMLNFLRVRQSFCSSNNWKGTSPVILWLRIRLPMQGTQFWPLIWEDPPCCGATELAHGNYWAHCALETALRNNMCHCREKPAHRNEEQPSLATHILTVFVLNGLLCVSCTPCLTHTPVVIWCKT